MEQKKILNKFIDTSRYVYNRTLEYINNGYKPNFKDLRDLLVTDNTKKGYEEYKAFDLRLSELREQKKTAINDDEKNRLECQIKEQNKLRRDLMKTFAYQKNQLVLPFETETPKDIRSNAVKRCCDAIKLGFSNLRNGNIKFFKMKYKKKNESFQSIELSKKNISIKNNEIKMLPETFQENSIFKIDKRNKRKLRNITIDNNVDVVRNNRNEYYLHIPLKTYPSDTKSLDIICGIDPGIRTFATVHSSNVFSSDISINEYKHRQDLLKKFNKKLDMLKQLKRIRKKQIVKIENRKSNLVDKLHWDVINDVLQSNDVVYYGDIKSHDIVKGGKNKTLNLNFNDLKFYQFKQRLLYKAYCYGKKVFFVKEHHTTKTCSCCGEINNNVGSKEIFECHKCKNVTGRDFNASKNIKMKGIITML